MIAIDPILLEFVKENFVTLGLILGILKVIAVETPWAVDNKILQIFSNFLTRNRPNGTSGGKSRTRK